MHNIAVGICILHVTLLQAAQAAQMHCPAAHLLQSSASVAQESAVGVAASASRLRPEPAAGLLSDVEQGAKGGWLYRN